MNPSLFFSKECNRPKCSSLAHFLRTPLYVFSDFSIWLKGIPKS